MKKETHINILFLDIGGVLLSDGWDRNSRRAGAKKFHLDHNDMEERHHLNFETYELGKMSLDEYLDRVVFYKKRNFNPDEFKTFMFRQSQPLPQMIALITSLKKDYGLKIAVISNEGRELNEYRIKKFKLNEFIDFFISSSFVNLRKPDATIFRLALDIAQVTPGESIYIDNQPLFVSIAERFGIKGISHTSLQSTRDQLNEFGLNLIPASHE
ncbi:HAD family hydrolase [Pedobacter cryoconitis]|uniref:HAD family hydrolase n=1 Tax=Pedobacter cryoconitis TaxID=188932 RepID=UPI001FECF758|nr:HAD hydrolase-like protein [Pedobacter cryoconitis]